MFKVQANGWPKLKISIKAKKEKWKRKNAITNFVEAKKIASEHELSNNQRSQRTKDYRYDTTTKQQK